MVPISLLLPAFLYIVSELDADYNLQVERDEKAQQPCYTYSYKFKIVLVSYLVATQYKSSSDLGNKNHC